MHATDRPIIKRYRSKGKKMSQRNCQGDKCARENKALLIFSGFKKRKTTEKGSLLNLLLNQKKQNRLHKGVASFHTGLTQSPQINIPR